MKAFEDIKFQMDLDLDMLGNAKQSGMMGLGGAIVLLWPEASSFSEKPSPEDGVRPRLI